MMYDMMMFDLFTPNFLQNLYFNCFNVCFIFRYNKIGHLNIFLLCNPYIHINFFLNHSHLKFIAY